jgi:hypothetical protein
VGPACRRRRPCGPEAECARETRIGPCPPALTALLHAHLSEHATAADGRLFRGWVAASWRRAPTAGCGAKPGYRR